MLEQQIKRPPRKNRGLLYVKMKLFQNHHHHHHHKRPQEKSSCCFFRYYKWLLWLSLTLYFFSSYLITNNKDNNNNKLLTSLSKTHVFSSSKSTIVASRALIELTDNDSHKPHNNHKINGTFFLFLNNMSIHIYM